ncbi:MAG: ATP-binding protein [Fimbriimonadaceae bacterium]|nr:ATP-binding protein [Fimbriimonadaceae bacterium]
MPGAQQLDVAGFLRTVRGMFRDDLVCLRELVQNSLEAVHQAFGERTVEAQIDVRTHSGPAVLEVYDNGIGMTADELRTKLTVRFQTGWAREQQATLGIGQFGFGFYSVFLACDKVTVTSRSRRDPNRAHRLVLDLDGHLDLAKVDPAGTPLGTTVRVPLRPDLAARAAPELVASSLQATFLHTPYQVTVNGRAVGIPDRRHWQASLEGKHGSLGTPAWFQERYGWSSLPLTVVRLEEPLRGWLVVTPAGQVAPGVEVYRRGIAATKQELIPPPLNYFLTALVDAHDLALRPDRESLVDDTALADLKTALASQSVKAVAALRRSQPAVFEELLQAHRPFLVEAMGQHRELRQAVGPSYAVQLYRPGGAEEERQTIDELADRSQRIVWVADGRRQQVLADRAYHLGQAPVVLSDEREQTLVAAICADHGIQLVDAAKAYLNEMRRRQASAPRAERVFRQVLPDDCDLLTCQDQDGRFPLKVVNLRPQDLPRPQEDRFLQLLYLMMREAGSKSFAVIHADHPLVTELEAGQGPPTKRELRLAKTVFFVARLACGVPIAVDEASDVYQLLLDHLH